MKNIILLSVCLIGIVLPFPGNGHFVFAGDLDDGLSTYTEEPISADDEALKADKNINFVVQQAKTKAQKKNDKNTNFKDGGGDQNQNSIVVGAGAQTGDIINVIIEKK
ncbi:MAG: hypothetical protein HOP35_07445 [Nitrospira sp.]|nr:hypothetical protein [Nitrospira sp.]